MRMASPSPPPLERLGLRGLCFLHSQVLNPQPHSTNCTTVAVIDKDSKAPTPNKKGEHRLIASRPHLGMPAKARRAKRRHSRSLLVLACMSM
jgi:hypothetical protein